MRKNLIIIIILIALFVVGLPAIKRSKNPPVTPNLTKSEDAFTNPNINAEQLCYSYQNEGGDKNMLSVDIRGDNVIGEYYILPFEKDLMTGVFKGKITQEQDNSRIINAIWDAKSEGVVTKTEINFRLKNSIASPGTGGMRQKSDGSYVYNDPKNISYDLNLQQTSCGDENMD
jgi:hypothetical protein